MQDIFVTGTVTVKGKPFVVDPPARASDYQTLFAVLAKYLPGEDRATYKLPMALRWARIRTWEDVDRYFH